MCDAVVERYGRVHRSVHGDGHDVLSRVAYTCEEMLRDRGCSISERTALPLAAAVEAGRPLLRGIAPDVDVYVHAEERVGVKAARAALEARTHADVCVVIVSVEGPTPFTKRECEDKNVQFFVARELCVNVTRHALVPRHERVEAPPEGVALDKLPKMLESDKVAQYYRWPPGTCVRVWRRFGGHEGVPYFRVVVAT
jgi:DNA-directed RNA polymerase subunit H (RpoH/RPB5)